MEKVLNIASKLDSLREVEKLVDEVSMECHLSSAKYGNVMIATMEAANNAILHGNKLNAEKDVFINFSWSPQKLTLTVTDQGRGFDFAKIPDPTSPENVEKVNGRGVFFMERLSDQISFKDKGRRVSLTFNL